MAQVQTNLKQEQEGNSPTPRGAFQPDHLGLVYLNAAELRSVHVS